MTLSDTRLKPAAGAWFKSSYSGAQDNCIEVAHVPGNFRKSSYSGSGGNCVEVAALPCVHAVRDSKHPARGHLAFAPEEWDAFLNAVKDHLL